MTSAGRIITGLTGPTKQVPLIGLMDWPDDGDREYPEAAMALVQAVAQQRPGLFSPLALLPSAGSASLAEPELLPLSQVARWMAGNHDTAVVVPVSLRRRQDTETTVRQVIADAARESGVRLITARSISLDDPVLSLLDQLCQQARVSPQHLVVLLAMWPTDPAWDGVAHDLATTWSARRPGPVRVEFSGPDRPNRKALSAYRDSGDVFGVIPIALPSAREHLWSALAKSWGIRVTPSVGHVLPELILSRYDEATPTSHGLTN